MWSKSIEILNPYGAVVNIPKDRDTDHMREDDWA